MKRAAILVILFAGLLAPASMASETHAGEEQAAGASQESALHRALAKVRELLQRNGIDPGEVPQERLEALALEQEVVDRPGASYEERLSAQKELLRTLFELLGQELGDEKLQQFAEQTIRAADVGVGGESVEAPSGPVQEPLDTPFAHVEVRGTGRTDLILLSNFAQDWTAWTTFMDKNSSRFRMTAVTLPGFANTKPPPLSDSHDFRALYWLDNAVLQLYHLIKSRNIEAPVLVGHGGGAYLAVRFSAEHPGLVRGSVVVNGRIRASSRVEPGLDEEARHALGAGFYNWMTKAMSDEEFQGFVDETVGLQCDSPDRREELETVAYSTERNVTARYFSEIMAATLDDYLQIYKKPLLVTVSVGDNAEHWRPTVDSNDNRSLVEFPEAGYLIMETAPDKLGKAIEEFLADN